MSELIIRQMFETRLKAFADDNDYPVAYENAAFSNDDAKKLHLEAYLLPAAASNQFMNGKHTALTGVFQISISYPDRDGAGNALAIAIALRSLFKCFLTLSDSSGFSVQIMTPLSIATAIQSGAAYVIPTSFEYRTDVTT